MDVILIRMVKLVDLSATPCSFVIQLSDLPLDSHTSEKPEHVQTSYKQVCKSLCMQQSAADAASVRMQSCPTTNRQGLWEATSDSPAIGKLHVDMTLQQDSKQVHIVVP